MENINTAADYANDYRLFAEYIDPDQAFVSSREDFEALSIERREELAQLVIDANA